jgi:hypothetical protein
MYCECQQTNGKRILCSPFKHDFQICAPLKRVTTCTKMLRSTSRPNRKFKIGLLHRQECFVNLPKVPYHKSRARTAAAAAAAAASGRGSTRRSDVDDDENSVHQTNVIRKLRGDNRRTDDSASSDAKSSLRRRQ